MCAGRQDLVRGSSAFVARPAPALFADFCHAEVLAGLPAGVRAPLHGAVTAVAHLPAGQLAGPAGTPPVHLVAMPCTAMN